MAFPPLVNCTGGVVPSCPATQTSSSPLLSEMNAIFDPSGDHRGNLSWAPDVLVKFRVGPFSTGAEKISPRAENRTRSPFGLRLLLSTSPPAGTRLGRRFTPSSGTLTEMV